MFRNLLFPIYHSSLPTSLQFIVTVYFEDYSRNTLVHVITVTSNINSYFLLILKTARTSVRVAIAGNKHLHPVRVEHSRALWCQQYLWFLSRSLVVELSLISDILSLLQSLEKVDIDHKMSIRFLRWSITSLQRSTGNYCGL